MYFDIRKVIENPKRLPDGEYMVGDFMGALEEMVISDDIALRRVVLDNTTDRGSDLSYWKFYYPIDGTTSNATKTIRDVFLRKRAPLWDRMQEHSQ